MVKSCYVYGCKKRFIKNSSVSFHKFPTDPEMRKKWIKAIKRENFIPSKDAVVCSEHFLSTDFLYLIGRRTLLKDAVPRRSRRKTSLQDVVSKNLPSTSKAFSESYRNQIEICKPKTAAERMKAYRARKKVEKYKNKPEKGKPKTAAERMRAYRARKNPERFSDPNQQQIKLTQSHLPAKKQTTHTVNKPVNESHQSYFFTA